MKTVIQTFLVAVTFLIPIACYAMEMPEEVVDSSGKGRVFNSMGGIYTNERGYEAPETHKPISYYEAILDKARRDNNRSAEIDALNNLGIAYDSIGQYGKAVEAYEQTLSIIRSAADATSILNNLALTYASINRYDKAIENYTRALEASAGQREPDLRSKGVILNNLGGAYRAQRQYEKAINAYQQALTLLELEPNSGSRKGEEMTLSNLGGVYKSLGQYDAALDHFQRALVSARRFANRSAEAKILNNIGATYNAIGRQNDAIKSYQQALAIKREINDRAGESATLNNLMFGWKTLGQNNLAIFFGKQAVNAYQDLRAGIQRLDKETQQGFLSSNQDTYRVLSDLLIGAGRLPEAQQVLKLTKMEEYFNFVRRDQGELAPTSQTDLTTTETGWEQRYREISDRLAAIGVERGALLAKTRTDAEEQRLALLENDIIVANKAFQSFLDSLTSESGRSSISKDKLTELRESQAMMEDLRELGNGTVALYTLVGNESYRIILVTADIQKAAEYRITAADLNDKILKFRESLENPGKDPKPLAQELYRILVEPVAKDLENAGAKTLMWSLDGTLRYLPINALHDGKHYLIERFRNVVFTLASEPRLKDTPQAQWKGLGLGVSKAHQPSFTALPGVAAELHEIIREETDTHDSGIVPGIIKLDEAFTAESMRSALRARYPLVHIASHFSFKPGNETDSFLLLGDGNHLSLEEFRSLPNIFGGVDLLTLSACDTAMGGTGADGKEVEGFAVMAQRQGAKAVIASLWPVADQSTSQIMHEFYAQRQKNTGMLKLEALRQAQLALLNNTSFESATGEARGVGLPGTGGKPNDAPSFTHPYFWAPFILIGNWK
ncbi:MAG: CHAT domain-containing protein [Nitrosomonas sp.]|uniref:CHAT domain-containing protein n=1 Tax=Nitrosomonas sp. TaxID=42353 RepID=UPI0032EB704B